MGSHFILLIILHIFRFEYHYKNVPWRYEVKVLLQNHKSNDRVLKLLTEKTHSDCSMSIPCEYMEFYIDAEYPETSYTDDIVYSFTKRDHPYIMSRKGLGGLVTTGGFYKDIAEE